MRAMTTIKLKSHPYAKPFPLMKGDEFDDLVADIETRGQIEPIITYDGMILDGRNRYRACLKNKIEPVLKAGDDWIDDPAAYVRSANIHRRHLKAKDKREAIAKLIKAAPEKSNRQIAKQVDASHTHVSKVRAEMEEAGDVATVATSIDTKGRKQPRKRKPRLDGKPTTGEEAAPISDAEASAEARKAEHAALDGDQTKQPPRAEVAKLIRAWVKASPEAKRQFVRERWDEIARARKQLDANGASHEDCWIEGDTL
jgi:ParB-like chromosome segregation protein Spo0J